MFSKGWQVRVSLVAAAMAFGSLAVAGGLQFGQGQPTTVAPTRTGLPSPEEIKEALMPTRMPREFVATPADQPGNLGRRIHTFLNSVADSPVKRTPVVKWRMLILFYPHTDSPYKTLEGGDRHFKGSLAADQIKTVERGLTELPALVKWHSGGLAEMELTVRTIARPVTFSYENMQRLAFQYPNMEKDCKPELDQYNNPRHDGVIVIYHPGPIPQDLRGSGRGGLGGTEARLSYGDDGMWSGLAIDNLGVFVHEWMHGLDGFFTSQRYRVEPLHHVYAAHYQNRWHSPMLQGRGLDRDEMMYGYSRAAWMSGTPTSRQALPPVQPRFPAAGHQMATGRPIRFEWANTAAPSGYQLLIYPDGAYDVPLRTISTIPMSPQAVVSDLPAGRYVYTILARDGDKRSAVGDAVPFSVAAEASLAPIRVSKLSTEALVADGRAVPVMLSATSPAGIARVQASLVLADGTTMTAFLRRRSPNENESTYYGSLWLPPIESTAPMRALVRILVVDHLGRTASGDSAAMLIQPNKRPGFERPGGNVPMRVWLPNRVVENHITSGPSLMQVSFPTPGRPVKEIKGNVWIEFVSPTGQKHWIAVDERGWDDTATSERQAFFRFPTDGENPNQIWRMAVCFRDPSGEVTRQDHTLVFSPETLTLGFGEGVKTPAKSDGVQLEGFAANGTAWRLSGAGDGKLSQSMPPSTAYRIRSKVSAKNDLVLFSRDTPVEGAGPLDMQGLAVVIGGWANTASAIRWNGREITRTGRYRLPGAGAVEVVVTRIGWQVMVHVDGLYLMSAMIPGESTAHTHAGVFAAYGGEQAVEAFELASYGKAANL